MTASEALVEGRRTQPAVPMAKGSRRHVVQLAGCEAAVDGEGARIAEAQAQTSSTSTWAARPSTSPAAVRLGADARPRSCAEADRGDGRRGAGAGDAEDAAWLGRSVDQRAGARPPGGAAGVRIITVHGRTRCQFYKGGGLGRGARRQASVAIPVVVNGDICSARMRWPRLLPRAPTR